MDRYINEIISVAEIFIEEKFKKRRFKALQELLSKAKEKSYKSPTAQVCVESVDGSSRWFDDSLIPVVALEDLEQIIKEMVGEK